jgi:hypothetical protein
MNKPANISRERLRQLRLNARGLCAVASCGKRKTRWGLCGFHREEEADRNAKRYQERKRKAAAK